MKAIAIATGIFVFLLAIVFQDPVVSKGEEWPEGAQWVGTEFGMVNRNEFPPEATDIKYIGDSWWEFRYNGQRVTRTLGFLNTDSFSSPDPTPETNP